jgi:hypothetical protein
MSCPMSVHYIVGHRSAESLMQDFSALERIGVRHLKDTAETIDRAARVVVTASERLPYDFLVLSPGISYMESAIPGFAEHRDKLPVGFRAFEQQAVKAALDAYEGGDIVLSVPPMPFRCPIAPYERAAMFAEWMNDHDKPGKVILLDQNPGIPIGKPVISAAFAELYGPDRARQRRRVPVGQRRDEDDRDQHRQAHLWHGRARAAAAGRGSHPPGRAWRPLGPGGVPELPVGHGRGHLHHRRQRRLPLPKSGHLAFESGVRVAQHIADRVRDGQAEAPLDLPSAICFAAFNAREAMGVNVTAEWDGFLNEVKRQPMVDKARSADALNTADAWSKSVWRQLLG